MRVGVFFAGFDMEWPDFRRLWTAAEALGFDSGWTMDNVIGPLPLDPNTPVFEPYTVLSAVAEATARIRLGPLVTPAGRRHPALVAKMVAVLDHISGGRVTLGLGADDEARHFLPWGMEYPSRDERVQRVGEAAKVIRLLWNNESSTWRGTHYHLDEAVLYPKPIQKPSPPIWIGVVRPENTELLRIAGELADGVNVFHACDENIPQIRSTVERAALAEGRDPSTITWSRLLGITFASEVGDVDTAVTRMAEHAGSFGADVVRHFDLFEQHIVGPPDHCVERLLDQRALGFDEVILHLSFDVDGLLRGANEHLDAMHTFADTVMPHLESSTPRAP